MDSEVGLGIFHGLENELVYGRAHGFGHRAGHGVGHELSHSLGGDYDMTRGGSHGCGGSHNKSHGMDPKGGHQGNHGKRGSTDIDWTMEDAENFGELRDHGREGSDHKMGRDGLHKSSWNWP